MERKCKGSEHHLEKVCKDKWEKDPSPIKLRGGLVPDTRYALVEPRMHVGQAFSFTMVHAFLLNLICDCINHTYEANALSYHTVAHHEDDMTLCCQVLQCSSCNLVPGVFCSGHM